MVRGPGQGRTALQAGRQEGVPTMPLLFLLSVFLFVCLFTIIATRVVVAGCHSGPFLSRAVLRADAGTVLWAGEESDSLV
jgi:hypothetical protein